MPFKTQLLETLNPPVEPRKDSVIAEFEYWHPLLNQAAIQAQQELTNVQGLNHTYYAGAWLKNGFHEDGLSSALNVVDLIGAANFRSTALLAAE